MPFQRPPSDDIPLDALPFPQLCKKLESLYKFASPSDMVLMCDIIEELANRMRTRGYVVRTSQSSRE